MQQLQLLDLNEGKILELGKDFLYGGEFIQVRENCQIQNKKAHRFYEFYKTPLSESTHTKLIPILEKTGAELFGDRYVLMENGIGDIIFHNPNKTKIDKRIIRDKKQEVLIHERESVYDIITYENKDYLSNLEENDYSGDYVRAKEANIFQEYFLLLKGEPNKFEEFYELVK